MGLSGSVQQQCIRHALHASTNRRGSPASGHGGYIAFTFGKGMKTRLVIVMGLLASLLGCSRPDWVEGGLYYTRQKDGSYSVFKLLKIDDGGFHVRLYSNQFPDPPRKVEESKLFMAGMDRKPNERLGMGHCPVSKNSFLGWGAIFIQQSTVSAEELEGYKMWLDAKGGYF